MFKKIVCISSLLLGACFPSGYSQDPNPKLNNLPTSESLEFAQPLLPSNRTFQEWTKHYDIYVDYSVNSSYDSEISSALMAWNHTMNGFIVFNTNLYRVDTRLVSSQNTIKNSSYHCIIKMYYQDDEEGTLSFIQGKTIYFVRNYIRQNNVFEATAHEVFHLLGGEHDQLSTLAHPVREKGNYREFDPRAIIQIARYQNIPLDRLNCVRRSCKF